MKRSIGCAVLALLAPGAVLADEPAPLPVWEVGVALGGVAYPDYRGSSHYNVLAVPSPFVIYRGERLKLGRDGIKAELIEGSRLELSLSAGVSLPGDSDSADSPRAGMPELLPTFEIGTSLDWWMREPELGEWNWRLRLPVRAVMATDIKDFEWAGWIASPHVRADRAMQYGDWAVYLGMSAGAVLATDSYHDYFYEVEPQFATPERPAYSPGGGYSGTRLGLSVGVVRGRWRVWLGGSHDLLSGAAFEDSPLVEEDSASVVGLGLSYSFWASRKVVIEEAPDT